MKVSEVVAKRVACYEFRAGLWMGRVGLEATLAYKMHKVNLSRLPFCEEDETFEGPSGEAPPAEPPAPTPGIKVLVIDYAMCHVKFDLHKSYVRKIVAFTGKALNRHGPIPRKKPLIPLCAKISLICSAMDICRPPNATDASLERKGL